MRGLRGAFGGDVMSFLLRQTRISITKATMSVLLGALLANSVGAQVVGGTLSGIVSDPSGALIPNARISIENPATGNARSVVTDAAGFYTAPNLLPGSYKVTVVASGVATELLNEVTLTVGAQQVLNFTLRVGSLTEAVHVLSEAPPVETATSSIGAVVNSTTIRELPLNGRSWTDLATLQPGVAAIETQRSFAAGSSRGNRGFGLKETISGARPQQDD